MTKAKIAYIEQRFPNLTLTFIYRELYALEAQGYAVKPLSIHQPDPANLSAEAMPLLERTTYIYPLNKGRLITANLQMLGRLPLRYLSLLLWLLTRPHNSLNERRRTLLHFIGGVYLACRIRSEGIEHVHAHFSVNGATMALVIARLLGISYSFTAHNSCFTEQLLLPEKIKTAEFIATISDYTRQFLLGLVDHDPALASKFHIIHCGVDPDQFVPPRKTAVSHPPLILSIAQLAERKGMTVLIEACRLLHEQGVSFECWIAGDGPQRAELKAQINRYGLTEKVKLLGLVYQEEIRALFAKADLFALACQTTQDGDKDGIPVVLMEAMAMTLPVVTTAVSGIPELVEDGVSGLVVAEQEPAAFAAALQQMFAHAERRQRYGENGRQKIIADFNIHKTASQLASLFDHYLSPSDYRSPKVSEKKPIGTPVP